MGLGQALDGVLGETAYLLKLSNGDSLCYSYLKILKFFIMQKIKKPVYFTCYCNSLLTGHLCSSPICFQQQPECCFQTQLSLNLSDYTVTLLSLNTAALKPSSCPPFGVATSSLQSNIFSETYLDHPINCAPSTPPLQHTLTPALLVFVHGIIFIVYFVVY